MVKKRIHVNGAKILIMGLAFKENCPDLRNSKVADVIRELQKYGATVDVYDPWVDRKEAQHEYGILPIKKPSSTGRGQYDAVVMAVAHDQFRRMGINRVRKLARRKHVLFDIKYVFKTEEVDGRL
jgi:UDP-N-acetyl-D-galactosamine dehydrogenase